MVVFVEIVRGMSVRVWWWWPRKASRSFFPTQISWDRDKVGFDNWSITVSHPKVGNTSAQQEQDCGFLENNTARHISY